MRGVALVTAAAAVVTLCGLLVMPRGLTSGDEGVKLIEAHALSASGFTSRVLTYPGSEMDPDGRFFPLRPPFAYRRGQSWYGLYPLPFAAASALGWRAFGFRGIFLLPWMGAIASVALAGLLARRALGSDRWATAVAGAAAATTPLLIYGTLHWEHSVAVALVLGALLLLADERPRWWRVVAAGVLVGAGPAFRTELYCVPPAVAVFALLAWGVGWRALVRLAAAFAVALAVTAAFWRWNQAAVGMWDPVVVVNRSFVSVAQAKWDGWSLLATRAQKLWLLCALAMAAGFLPGRARMAVAGVVCVWAGALSLQSALRTEAGQPLVGLLSASPIVILGVARGLLWRQSRLAAACTGAALALIVAMLCTGLSRIGGGGLQFGSRYLLPAAPLLLIGAAELAQKWPRTLAPAAAGLALVSIVATIFNVRTEVRIRAVNAQLAGAVEQSGARDVVTHFFWVPQVLAPLWPTHRLYLWSDAKLLTRLVEHGVTNVVRVHGGLFAGPDATVALRPERVLVPPDQVVVYSLVRAEP